MTSDAQKPSIPDAPLAFGAFSAQFRGDGTFSIAGEGWPSMRGRGRDRLRVALRLAGRRPSAAARAVHGRRERPAVTFTLVSDGCVARRMILDRSQWLPASEATAVPERRIVADRSGRARDCPRAAAATGAGRRSADAKRPASRTGRNCRTRGMPRPARTSCGAPPFPDSRTRVRSSGATRSS